MSNDYIPPREAEFVIWVTNLINTLKPMLTRLGFPETVYGELLTLQGTFNEKLAIANTPSTRTKATIEDKNEALAALKKGVRDAVGEYLTRNHMLTNADRDNLGLPIHKTTHTPSPKATTSPESYVDSGTIRQLTIHFFDQGSESKAKPEGQHGAEIRWAILDKPPAGIDDLIHSSFDTHTPFTLTFTEEQRGQTVYFCLCWENTRGEKGPNSEIHHAIIP
jgi:hypothetical protein